LNWYLKYWCNASVSWGVNGTGNQLRLPVVLPAVAQPFRMASPHLYRYYMNVCTLSFSTVWWTWERWEQELDWMALNGINLPLAYTGQEWVWNQLWSSLGLPAGTYEFTGPAYLAWVSLRPQG
jgi:alpha-N-acetylglucosaminidase